MEYKIEKFFPDAFSVERFNGVDYSIHWSDCKFATVSLIQYAVHI